MTTASELVPPEVLAPPSARERRRIDRDLCAPLLDGYLHRLAHQEAAGRRVLGRLAAGFLRVRAHEWLGFVRLDDYARERLGLSGREVQELARVARGLEGLPRLAAAFAAGEISWTHVRLLASIATPGTEAGWLARARSETVRELAAAVGAGATHPPEPDDPDTVDGETRVRFHLRCPRRVRRLWVDATELASRVCGARLPAWRAAEAITAEGLSGKEAVVHPVAEPGPHAPALEANPLSTVGWEAVAEAVPDEIALLARAPDNFDPHCLDERMRRAIRALQRIDWQTGRLLALVAELRLYRALGCPSLAAYVRERLGLSLRKARALLALERRARQIPALAEAYREGRLSFSRALVLLPVLHPATAAAWITRAQEVTVRRLADLVAWALEAREAADEPVAPPPAEGGLVLPPLDGVQMCARDRDAAVTFHGPASVVALLWTAVHAYTPRGAPAWRGLEALLLHATAEWRRLPRHRDPIFERDGWRCAVPACTARSSLHDHHVVYRSRGGDNRRDNRVAICAAHHLRGIHHFRVKVSGQAPDDLTWELGCRGPARPPLLRTHGDRYLEGGS